MIYNIFIASGVIAILVVLLAERRWQKKNQVKVYQIADTVTNTACGISDRVFNIFFDTIQFVLWSSLYAHVALVKLPVSVLGWFGCLVIVDFIWYWYHRMGHEVRLFWAVHSLHHQSEEFNISVGFRISIFQSILRGVFWLLLPILGFHPELILTVLVFHGLYQLPLHTKVAPKLGFLEYIFVTPSSHRVHHGVNEEYLDKNYGGVFIIWDRIFGTYAPETTEVVYGITDRTGNLGFLQAHIYGFRQLILPKQYSLPPKEKLRYVFKKPSYVPQGVQYVYKPEIKQFEVQSELTKYIMAQVVMSSIITIFFIFFRHNWPIEIKSVIVFFIFWTIASATLRYNQIGLRLLFHEFARNICIGTLTVYLYYQHIAPIYIVVPIVICILISILLLPVEKVLSALK